MPRQSGRLVTEEERLILPQLMISERICNGTGRHNAEYAVMAVRGARSDESNYIQPK